MNNIINKFYNIVDKIGKRNIILIIFLLIVIIVAGLYTTFSLYTTTDGTSLVDGIMTYKFILNNSNEESSVTIASNSSKNVAITISNPESISLKYGLYYSSIDDISSVNIGYLSTSSKLPKDTIPGNNDYTVTIKIDNTSSSSVTIKFGIVYGLESGGELSLPSGKSWLDEYITPYTGPLNGVDVGSYVAYTGNNGCSGNSCSGQNANYVSDTDMGYCMDSSYKFSVNGWRVGYISDGTAYLVSAGAPECIATDSSGNMDNSGADTDTWLDADNLYKHLDNLDNESLLYCNTNYAYGGVCDSTSTWAMDATDFQAITGSALSSDSCLESSEDSSCGYGNDLIDNGGLYWYATRYSASSVAAFYWNPYLRYVYGSSSNFSLGVRPVLRLQSSVQVVGGSGTYGDPYQISN